jgi:hypothetical protein
VAGTVTDLVADLAAHLNAILDPDLNIILQLLVGERKNTKMTDCPGFI